MPLPADDAVTRRDETLARTRRASRWITAAAIAAAVTLGTAFAHALPGHHATAQAATAPGQPGGSGAPGAGQHPARHHHPAGHHHHGSHQRRGHQQLTPPPQPPASSPAPQPTSTPTPPPVVSGGS